MAPFKGFNRQACRQHEKRALVIALALHIDPHTALQLSLQALGPGSSPASDGEGLCDPQRAVDKQSETIKTRENRH